MNLESIKYRKKVPKVVGNLIEDLLDEDATNPNGTAEKAANDLLERAVKKGRDSEFKEAMKFWKNAKQELPPEVLWQWFTSVFEGTSHGKSSNKHKSKGRRRRKAP